MPVKYAMKMLAARAITVRATPENVPSPCVSICRMDAQGHCEGCLRTLDEIRRWSTASDAEKRTVWSAIESRIATARLTPDPSTSVLP